MKKVNKTGALALALAYILLGAGCGGDEAVTAVTDGEDSTFVAATEGAEQTGEVVTEASAGTVTAAPETDEPQSELVTTETYEGSTVYDPDVYDDTWIVAALDRQIIPANTEWSMTGRGGAPVYRDGYAGADSEDSWFDLSCLVYVGSEEAAKFEFELKTNTDLTDATSALFVGLRTNSDASGADENGGIWLSFKNNIMGIRAKTDGAWSDGIVELTLPYSFSGDFRRVYIEDDRAGGIIRVYQGNDEGKKQLVYKLYLTVASGSCELTVYSYADSFNTAQQTVQCGEIYHEGYFKLRSYNIGGVYIKNCALKTA